ncbi:MAG: hypothetical protein BMS9Abin13_336 [Patescibacteria group bacterium]|nr:MAG: hypothetical protein BMS9Abin13_336 [Patescibacteria group bacterium]
MKKTISLLAFLAVTPLVASAQTLSDILTLFSNMINALVPFLIGLGALYFIWGVLKFVMAGDDQEARANGRSMMIYGIIALFAMVSVWGLVNVLVNTFGLSAVAPTAPTTPFVPGF